MIREAESHRPPFGRGPFAAGVLAAVINAAAHIGGAIPAGFSHKAAVLGGSVEWALRRGKRDVLAENLSHALGCSEESSVRRAVHAEVVNEARRSADLLWSLSRPSEMLANVRIENIEAVEGCAAAGRGVILAGPHIGGWEIVAPLPYAVFGRPATAIVTDDWLAWAMQPYRERAGLLTEFASRPPRVVAERLRRGGVALLLADIVPPGARTFAVRLLDGTVDLPAGPATLARIGNAVVVPLAVLPIAPRAWRVVLGDPIEPPSRRSGRGGEQRMTQALADAWEPWLREYPEHWAAVYPLSWNCSAAVTATAPSAAPAATSAR